MKKLLIVISLATVTLFAACHNRAKEEAAKEQALTRARIEKAFRDSLKLDSFKKSDSAEKAQLAGPKDQAALATQNSGSLSATNSSAGGQTQVHPKKGWSSAAKGAVIGGAGGAIGGAIVGKGKGAAIGAVVGAGTGYVIGRAHDRKTGRVQRHKTRHKTHVN